MKNTTKKFPYGLSLALGVGLLAVFASVNFYSLLAIKSSKPSRPQVKGISTVNSSTSNDSSDSDPADSTLTGSEAAIWQKLGEIQDQVDQINNQATNTAPVSEVYKLVSQIDSCQLNKLTKQGWRISQMGSVVTSLGGAASSGVLDENCKPGTPQLIDWAVLQKP